MDQQPLKVKFLETPSSCGLHPMLESPAPYLVDLPAHLPNSPHQELLQAATLGAWPPILPNQAPGGIHQTQDCSGDGEPGRGHGTKDQEEGKEGGLDKGK